MISAVAAQRVKLVVFDVDGVLTDAGYYLGDVDGKPSELLRYNIQDGIGIVILRAAGIKVALITGRESESVRLRAAELKVDALVQDKQARKTSASRSRKSRLSATTFRTSGRCASWGCPSPSPTR
jgi:3-deoxy-D-manno-octulosonate 8-phosphate phosphatase (KDO 8-P phosphatase)